MRADVRWKARRAAVALVLAGALFTFAGGPALWQWVTRYRNYECIDDFAGWTTYSRFTNEPDGEERFWHQGTGMLVTHSMYFAGETRATYWDINGNIVEQEHELGGRLRILSEPPWLWGVSEQTSPSAPWIGGGLTLREWYRTRIPDEDG